MKIPRVITFNSPTSGAPIPNQFKIRTDKGLYYQSYDAPIAFVPNGGAKLDTLLSGGKFDPATVILDRRGWDYSKTTLKYLSQFLGVKGKKDIEAKIKTGEFVLLDLMNY